MTVYTFRPPTTTEPLGGGGLFRFYRRKVGIALLVTGSAVVEKRHPTTDELDAADAYYLGGHVYEIGDAAAAVLVGAGYGALLAPTPDVYGDDYGESY